MRVLQLNRLNLYRKYFINLMMMGKGGVKVGFDLVEFNY